MTGFYSGAIGSTDVRRFSHVPRDTLHPWQGCLNGVPFGRMSGIGSFHGQVSYEDAMLPSDLLTPKLSRSSSCSSIESSYTSQHVYYLSALLSEMIPLVAGLENSSAIRRVHLRNILEHLFSQGTIFSDSVEPSYLTNLALIALSYLTRIKPRFGFTLIDGNDYRAFVAALMIAQKTFDDYSFGIKQWSSASGIPRFELEILERRLLHILQFNVNVSQLQLVEISRFLSNLVDSCTLEPFERRKVLDILTV